MTGGTRREEAANLKSQKGELGKGGLTSMKCGPKGGTRATP